MFYELLVLLIGDVKCPLKAGVDTNYSFTLDISTSYPKVSKVVRFLPVWLFCYDQKLEELYKLIPCQTLCTSRGKVCVFFSNFSNLISELFTNLYLFFTYYSLDLFWDGNCWKVRRIMSVFNFQSMSFKRKEIFGKKSRLKRGKGDSVFVLGKIRSNRSLWFGRLVGHNSYLIGTKFDGNLILRIWRLSWVFASI